jgi:glycosyltransferase involved in cell wall biosynthesis
MTDYDKKSFLSGITTLINLARSKDLSKANQLLSSLYSWLAKHPSDWAERQKDIIRKIDVHYGINASPYFSSNDLIGRSIDEFVQEIKSGVSLVTCCMNRSENLLKALPTWLQCPEINQIIIVDWGSKTSVRDEIIAAGIRDSRILVARVNNQPRWILSYAFNFGFRIAGYDKILKVDSDIQISPQFFQQNPLRPGTFLSGDWRTAVKGQEHINGFFYVRREDLLSIKGFNEYITTYGWDDDDIYFRLEQYGLNRVRIKPDSVYHIQHGDEQRVGNNQAPANALEELRQYTGTNIMGNRFLAGAMPIWNQDRIFVPFIIKFYEEGYLEAEQTGESYHQVPPHIRADADYYGLVNVLSWTTELSAYSIPKERLYNLLVSRRCRAEISRADVRLAACITSDQINWYRYLLILNFTKDVPIDEQVRVVHELYNSAQKYEFTIIVNKSVFEKLSVQQENKKLKHILPAPDGFHADQLPVCSVESLIDIKKVLSESPVNVINLECKTINNIFPLKTTIHSVKRRDRLYIHVQHGLGNRLRALASATVMAEATNRELILIWEPDHHCECEIGDLFNYTGTVINSLNKVDIKSTVQFNYMEIEPGSCKDGYISLTPGKDVYIKSAYALNNELTSWDKENAVLRNLRVVEAVEKLVRSVSVEGRLGVHIRMEGAKGTDHNTYDSSKNWSAESHRQLNEWRAKSHYSNFMKRIDALIQHQPELHIFLAADTRETYDIFANKYGNRLACLMREYFNRSRDQLRYALADAILLSRCDYLLGSTWSSFTELAMRLSINIKGVEMSGVDF